MSRHVTEPFLYQVTGIYGRKTVERIQHIVDAYHEDVEKRILDVLDYRHRLETARRLPAIARETLRPICQAALEHLYRERVRRRIPYGSTLYAATWFGNVDKRHVSFFLIENDIPVCANWLVRTILDLRIKDTPTTSAGIVIDQETLLRDVIMKFGRRTWGDGAAYEVAELR